MIWEQIAANRRRSALLITVLALVLAVMGYAAGEALAPGSGIIGLLVAAGIFAVQFGIYASNPAALLLQGAGAVELKREDSPRLFNIVEEMKIASGLPFTPRVYLVDDPAPNAFAMGHGANDGTIAVTSGLLQRLNRDELQGVVAHEIGHLRNRDVQFMTLAAVMLGTIVILSELIWRTMRYGGRGRRRSDSRGGGQAQLIILVVALLFAILGPLLAQLLYFACSRKREYLADACGAQYTRYPEGLASALEKISLTSQQVSFASKATAPMFIINPLAARGDAGNLFATHPPTGERVRVLRNMAGAGLGDYEAAYRRTTGHGLIGARSIQSAPAGAIRAASRRSPRATPVSRAWHRLGIIPLHVRSDRPDQPRLHRPPRPLHQLQPRNQRHLSKTPPRPELTAGNRRRKICV
jgi:heat shock protein HtpX